MERLVASGGALERVARGVYQLAGAPVADHRDLRAAWLQLAPEIPAWERTADHGVVSHRSAASLYGLGDLPADTHELMVPARRQTRRHDVRIHVQPLGEGEWTELGGLPVTMPSRIVADLLSENEDPEAVAQIITETIQRGCDRPGDIAESIAPYAARFGLRKLDGPALLRRMLALGGAGVDVGT